MAAGVYASRKRLKTVFISKDFGGQSAVSSDIQNWIGTVSVSGNDLAKNLKSHLLAYANDVLDVKEGEIVEKIEKEKNGFSIKTNKGSYEVKTALIASGSHRRKLIVPGAEKFGGKGITYCASCDGPLFPDMDVAVVGGGNAGFETAAELLAYAKSVTVLESRDEFAADPVTVKKVLSNLKAHGLRGVEILEIAGSKFVEKIIYKEKGIGDKKELPVQGVFVEIGATPTTEFARGLVELNKTGHIITDPRTGRTSVLGIWAAGDCADSLYHQNNIAAGDAVRALEDLYIWLQKN